MATSIQLRQIKKAYGDVQVIHGVDLTIEPGDFTVFVGPSGCGKSTLLRMIAGLEPITGGDLLIDGQRMNEVPAAKRGIATAAQRKRPASDDAGPGSGKDYGAIRTSSPDARSTRCR